MPESVPSSMLNVPPAARLAVTAADPAGLTSRCALASAETSRLYWPATALAVAVAEAIVVSAMLALAVWYLLSAVVVVAGISADAEDCNVDKALCSEP